MKKKSVNSNYIFNLVYQILIVFVPFIVTPYISRILEADGIGQYSYAQSYVSYFVLLSGVGTLIYGQREISRHRDDTQFCAQLFWEIFLLRVIGVTTSYILYFIIILPNATNRLVYILAALEILAVVFDISWYFQGFEDFSKITLCNGFSKIVSVFAIFIFVKSKNDLPIYILLYCGSIILGNISMWFWAFPYITKNRLNKIHIFSHLKLSVMLFIPQVALQIYTVLDKTMIGLITKSDYQNGYYEQAMKTSKITLAVVTALGSVMAPRITNLFYKNKKKSIELMLGKSFNIMWALSLPIAVGLFVVADRFVPIYYGIGYGDVIPLLKILCFLVPIIGASNIIGMQYLIPVGKEKYYTISLFSGAIINFTLNSILIYSLQAKGATIASVLAELCITIIQMFLVRRDLPLKKYFSQLYRYLFNSIIMGIIIYILGLRLDDSLFALLLMIFCGIFIYLMLLVIERDHLLSKNGRRFEDVDE